MIKELVSIIVPNYNGQKYLEDFFVSVFAQTHKKIEVIMVDNASSDSSVKFTEEMFPRVKVVERKSNSGYAGGANEGFRHSRGEYLLVVNNDTVMEKDLVAKMIGAFNEIPRLGAVQPMVRLAGDREKLDACGSFWTNTGFNYHYGIYKDVKLPIYNRAFPVYSLKGVCMMMPRKLVDKIGLFDDDFWCYFEETDFCHRVWLAGYECWYYPKTFIYHFLGSSSNLLPNPLVQYHSFKNRLCSYLKNLETKEFFKVVPVYFLMSVLWSLIYLFRGSVGGFGAVYRAVLWNVVNFRKTLMKRKRVQTKIRRRKDWEIFQKVRKNPRVKYYFSFLGGLQNYAD